jgi:hypothetical protein
MATSGTHGTRNCACVICWRCLPRTRRELPTRDTIWQRAGAIFTNRWRHSISYMLSTSGTCIAIQVCTEFHHAKTTVHKYQAWSRNQEPKDRQLCTTPLPTPGFEPCKNKLAIILGDSLHFGIADSSSNNPVCKRSTQAIVLHSIAQLGRSITKDFICFPSHLRCCCTSTR